MPGQWRTLGRGAGCILAGVAGHDATGFDLARLCRRNADITEQRAITKVSILFAGAVAVDLTLTARVAARRADASGANIIDGTGISIVTRAVRIAVYTAADRRANILCANVFIVADLGSIDGLAGALPAAAGVAAGARIAVVASESAGGVSAIAALLVASIGCTRVFVVADLGHAGVADAVLARIAAGAWIPVVASTENCSE